MHEGPKPVLTYEPPPPNRRRWAWFGAGVAAGVLATSFALMLAGRAIRTTGTPANVPTVVTWSGPVTPASANFSFPQAQGKLEITHNSIAVPYGKFVFFSDGRDVVALRMTCPSGDGEAIAYEWLHSAQGGIDFESPRIARGSSTSVEQAGHGQMTAGPFSLIWSQGSAQGGWVYWPARHGNLVVAHEMAARPQDFADVLSRTTWQDQDGTILDSKRQPIEGQ